MYKVIDADSLLAEIGALFERARLGLVRVALVEQLAELGLGPTFAQQLETLLNLVNCYVTVSVQVEHTEGRLEVAPGLLLVLKKAFPFRVGRQLVDLVLMLVRRRRT